MHEASIALAIADEVCDRANRDGMQRIANVHLRIGALTAIVPDALHFAWDLAADGTVASGSNLVIEYVPLTIHCAFCNARRDLQSTIPVCPVCDRSSNQIVGGRELEVTAMEVLHNAPAGSSSAEPIAQEQHARA